MKKLLSVFSIVLVFIFCFSLTVSADAAPRPENVTATISDDFQMIECDGIKFYRVNPQIISFDYYIDEATDEIDEGEIISVASTVDSVVTENFFVDFELTDEQKKTIYRIDVYNYNKIYLEISVNYNDGSALTGLTYLNEKYNNEYNALIKNGSENFLIDFIYPDNNFVYTDKANLIDEKLKTNINVEYINEQNEVYIENSDKSFRLNIGSIIKIEDTYYFYEYDVNNPEYYLEELIELDLKDLTVYELKDEKLLEDIHAAEQKYFDDDFGFLFNDELAETVSKIFFIIIFAVIPFAICIASMILGIRSKKKAYKKIFVTISLLSIAEVITFIATVIVLFK